MEKINSLVKTDNKFNIRDKILLKEIVKNETWLDIYKIVRNEINIQEKLKKIKLMLRNRSNKSIIANRTPENTYNYKCYRNKFTEITRKAKHESSRNNK